MSKLVFCRPSDLPDDITAASGDIADVQTAVNAAVDGDIVGIPAGSWTWGGVGATHLAFSNKNIWLRGAGIGQTTISSPGVRCVTYTVTNTAKGASQFSGISWTGTLTGAVIRIDATGIASFPTGRWRVHHCDFNFNNASRIGIEVFGISYGVIDHNTWTSWEGVQNAVRCSMFKAAEFGGGGKVLGDYMWSQPLDLGTNNFVFIEDNVFMQNPTSATGVVLYDSSSGGGRVVYRHNSSVAGFLYAHWTRTTEYGGSIVEVYQNSFTAGSGGAYDAYPARFEGGTGVWWGNTHSGWANNYVVLDDRRATGFSPQETNAEMGACDGTHDHDGNFGDPAAPGWPALGQPGRSPGKTIAAIRGGDKQTSAPFTIWDDAMSVNASPAAYVSASAHPNGDVDYVVGTPLAGYTPYTYPHPLVTAGWS